MNEEAKIKASNKMGVSKKIPSLSMKNEEPILNGTQDLKDVKPSKRGRGRPKGRGRGRGRGGRGRGVINPSSR